jgi:hypothetical protein
MSGINGTLKVAHTDQMDAVVEILSEIVRCLSADPVCDIYVVIVDKLIAKPDKKGENTSPHGFRNKQYLFPISAHLLFSLWEFREMLRCLRIPGLRSGTAYLFYMNAGVCATFTLREAGFVRGFCPGLVVKGTNHGRQVSPRLQYVS